MSTNRIIYNVQDVLIGPESSVPLGSINTGDYYILKRLDGVQSFNYSFSQNAEDVSILEGLIMLIKIFHHQLMSIWIFNIISIT